MRHSNHTSIARYGRVLVTGALGVTLGATLLAACSSSPKAGPATANVPGVTSNSITIGATVPLTGPGRPGIRRDRSRHERRVRLGQCPWRG